MYYNLKALIKAIRSTKTLADERSVIQKESAAIRTSFKEEETYYRYNNVAKLLYIHMLGHPAHFGQIECLKLVAQPRFADKRLGYLGIMLLLDESQEVLTLVTNSLKNDMNHSNMYIVGLALCTFANISSEEMSRDLVNEVEKLIGSSNTYIRKKAALCAMRIIKKVPELLDHFITKATSLLSDRNHGVLLCGVTLVTEMCVIDEEALLTFRKAVPLLVRHLKALVTTGYSPEHDVSGITDPFLQVKILRLLRVLGKGDVNASETMNDILAQVATNTEAAKNVGNSILYEAVLTILEIEAEPGLRVMAINILGKFLGNRDNNIRYVALNTLNKVVGIDTNSVQRHRTIILDCLRDGDISIRRRALELSYALINEQNVRVMIRELLAFLEVADNEFKLGMTTQICLAADRFAPNKRWHIDTMLRVLKLAGNYVREEVLSAFVRLVCHTPELQAYTAQKLYLALRQDVSQESLTLAGLWVIGEFGELMLESGGISVGSEEPAQEVHSSDIVGIIDLVLLSPYVNQTIRQFALTALAKLSSRLPPSSPTQTTITQILGRFVTSAELEIQQRAVEFSQLLTMPDIKLGVLERMPPPELKASVMGTVSEKRAVGSTRVDKDSLVDLMGDETISSSQTGAAGGVVVSAQNTQDLLADIFGGDGGETNQSSAPQPPKSSVNEILGLFGSTQLSPMNEPPTSSIFGHDILGGAAEPVPSLPQSFVAYDQNGLQISFVPQKATNANNILNITTQFVANGLGPIQNVNFQAAVPKTQKLQMLAISNSDINPGITETQQLRIMFPPGATIRLRLRISYTTSTGENKQDQTDYSFPTSVIA
ncbi:AP-1 complex subunit gamma-1 [Phakopsora pachyrhizi]|uniref:AP-1 complex subunit gamma n=1 Tax=Phakopsora pachyrhizi TaxID=170000 RepID=A0AAV0AGS5_PHAPC|nr:AP-1 complex subunit gamma-1 [Phakopsora pachyrhizi]CAH7665880.1 AP-1 complex subunit gamma-1 [Phakopsora pachyrhizi]